MGIAFCGLFVAFQQQAHSQSTSALDASVRIHQLELQQSRFWLTILILGLVLLGLMLLFLYAYFYQRSHLQQKEKMLLQQQLLRTQLDPHFIFNTLAAVQSFVRLGKTENAIKYLHRFSRLLRNSLELSRKDLVLLQDDMDTLEYYLGLQQMRYEDGFTYQIACAEDQQLSAVMLPPMLVQPYVEHAILHGMDVHSGKGHINVFFQLHADVLHVSITDNGKPQLDHLDTTYRVLPSMICPKRIRSLGKDAGVHITGSPIDGTVVTLHIPVVYG